MKPLSGLLLLLALPFALFWPVALGLKVFADGDLFVYNYPLLHTIAQQWKSGQVPLWNPYLFGGTPLLAPMQGGVFYPLNALFLILPPWLAYGESILLHYSLSGTLTFLYLRALGLLPAAAMVGGLVFMLGGFTLGSLGHVSTLRTIPWLPLMLWAFERWRGGRRASALLGGGAAAGFMVLAGHPQIPLYAFGVLASYALWLAVEAAGAERFRLIGGWLAMLGIGAGIAAVQVLPTLYALPEYLRPGEGGYEYFSKYSLQPPMLANIVFPEIVQSNLADQAVYVGIAPLLLAFVGARVAVVRGGIRFYFLALAAAGVLLALGENTPLHPWMHRLPPYGAFTAPSRNWFEVTFALSALAAFGVQGLLGEETATRARRACIGGLAGFALLLVLGSTSLALVKRGALSVTEPDKTSPR